MLSAPNPSVTQKIRHGHALPRVLLGHLSRDEPLDIADRYELALPNRKKREDIV
jgi:hypothetical protein